MNRSLLRAVPAFLIVAAGCGDIYSDPTASESSPPSGPPRPPEPPSTFDVVDEDLPPNCPPVQSPEGTGCNSVGSVCEYGKSPDRSCNTTLVCELTDNASRSFVARPKAPCPVDQCPGNATAAAIDGAPCVFTPEDGGAAADSDELLCAVDDSVCACTTGMDAAHAHDRRWVCTKPELGCPKTRPLFGERCTSDRTCDYGACASKRGLRMACQSGVWISTSATCP